MDQDRLGFQGSVVVSSCPPFVPAANASGIPACQQVWVRPLQGGSMAVVLVNFATQPATVACDATCFATLGITRAAVRDLWQHRDLGVMGAVSMVVPADGASVMLRLSPA